MLKWLISLFADKEWETAYVKATVCMDCSQALKPSINTREVCPKCGSSNLTRKAGRWTCSGDSLFPCYIRFTLKEDVCPNSTQKNTTK